MPQFVVPTLLIGLVVLLAVLKGFQLEIAFAQVPKLAQTEAPLIQPPPSDVGSYDVLGHVVDRETVDKLLETEEGQQQLSLENGAIAITED